MVIAPRLCGHLKLLFLVQLSLQSAKRSGILTLLHSEQPKLKRVMAVLSAKGLMIILRQYISILVVHVEVRA